MPDSAYVNHDRSLGQVIHDIKEEVREFLQTRASIFVSEMRETAKRSKSGIILGALALVLAWVGFLMLSVSLAALVAVAFWGSPYAWFLGFLIVALAWLITAGLLAFGAIRQLKDLGPKRTIQVLKEDKVWLQQEAQNQI